MARNKFPFIDFVIAVCYAVALITGIIGALAIFSGLGSFGVIGGIGILSLAAVPLFFGELLNILLEIEKNTRK